MGLKQPWVGRLDLQVDGKSIVPTKCLLPYDKTPSHGWAFDLWSESGGSAVPIATTRASQVTVSVDTEYLRHTLVIYLSVASTPVP